MSRTKPVAPDDLIPITMLPVADLKAHPDQAGVFDDLSDAQFWELVAHIEANGLSHPIDVLPDMTIVCGHQRVRAYRHLGRTHIPARVRHDWAAKGKDHVGLMLVTDNLFRHAGDPLTVARGYKFLLDKVKKMPRADRPGWGRGDLRDKLGERLNMSGRNLDRYLAVLDTPPEVQRALTGNKLTLVSASRVAHLPADEQAAIAKAIRAGQDPRKVVRGRLPEPARPQKDKQTLRAEFVFKLLQLMGTLEGQEDEVVALGTRKDDRNILTRATDLIDRMLKVENPDDGKEALKVMTKCRLPAFMKPLKKAAAEKAAARAKVRAAARASAAVPDTMSGLATEGDTTAEVRTPCPASGAAGQVDGKHQAGVPAVNAKERPRSRPEKTGKRGRRGHADPSPPTE